MSAAALERAKQVEADAEATLVRKAQEWLQAADALTAAKRRRLLAELDVQQEGCPVAAGGTRALAEASFAVAEAVVAEAGVGQGEYSIEGLLGEEEEEEEEQGKRDDGDGLPLQQGQYSP